MKTDRDIEHIIAALEKEALGYSGAGSKIQENRAMLLRRYNREQFGDEIEGQSSTVTSDVFDAVEGALPHLIRLFTQSRKIANFKPTHAGGEEEAKQKTIYANWVFQQQHQPLKLLHSYIKDCLLQYTGTMETYWDDSEEYIDGENYEGIDQIQYQKLLSDENYNINEAYIDEDSGLVVVKGVRTNKTGRVKIQSIPPNEMIVSKRAHDFIKPNFYGKNTVKTRSELLLMGFDRETIMALGQQDVPNDPVESARNEHSAGSVNSNPTEDRSQDTFRLGEYYLNIDVDEDGVAEYWKVCFITGENKLLEKELVDNHSLSTITCIPMPHRAIGECLASLVADHQYWHSTLVRNMNNNIYATNFSRLIVNDRVDDDEVYTPVAGGIVHVEGQGPVTGAIEPLVTTPQSDKIIQAIQLADTQKERRTGITAYNQGMDTDALNKTATGFVGIRDMSQMRQELVARIIAAGLQMVFERIIELASKYQRDSVEIMVLGEPMTIDPTQWKYKTECVIDIGIGGGERQERIQNLNYILEVQKTLKDIGSPLVDDGKIYHTLDKLAEQVGLFGAEQFFNDPERPEDHIMAENEQLRAALEQAQQQIQAMEPLTQSEQIRAASVQQKAQIEAQTKLMQEHIRAQGKAAELGQKDAHHDDNMAIELSKITADVLTTEATTGKDIDQNEITKTYQRGGFDQ